MAPDGTVLGFDPQKGIDSALPVDAPSSKFYEPRFGGHHGGYYGMYPHHYGMHYSQYGYYEGELDEQN